MFGRLYGCCIERRGGRKKRPEDSFFFLSWKKHEERKPIPTLTYWKKERKCFDTHESILFKCLQCQAAWCFWLDGLDLPPAFQEELTELIETTYGVCMYCVQNEEPQDGTWQQSQCLLF